MMGCFGCFVLEFSNTGEDRGWMGQRLKDRFLSFGHNVSQRS